MKSQEFKAWLAARGATSKAVSTRSYAVRTVEKCLRDLGFEHEDLDAAIDAGELDDIAQAIRDLRADAVAGGKRFQLLMPESRQPLGRLSSWASWVKQYGRFRLATVEVEGGERPTFVNKAMLEQLKLLFLRLFPNFVSFDEPSEAYREEEDSYKRALVTEAGRRMAAEPPLNDTTLGEALLDLIGNKKVNLLGYFKTYDLLSAARTANPELLERAAGALARSTEAEGRAVEAFNAVAWPLLAAGQEKSKPYGDSRIIPTLIAALVRPESAIAVRYQPFYNAGEMLLGRSLFANAPLSAAEYSDVLGLSRAIFDTMRDDWDWGPRDLWDVQGFIWVTCKKKLSVGDGGGMENQTLLARTNDGPVNLILHGPPGTGKTYATASDAVRLCGEAVPAQRAELMASYRRLADAGRIEFVTFHQSMAYEDFVEGLRPVQSSESGAAGFELQPTSGIFRRIARRAETSTGARASGFTLGDRQVFKMSIGDATKAEWAWLFDEAIEQGYAYLGFSDIDWSDSRFADRAAILAESRERGVGDGELNERKGPVKSPDIFRNAVQLGDVLVVSKGLNLFRAIGVVEGAYEYASREGGRYSHRRKVRWLWHDNGGVPVSEINANRFSIDTIYPMRRGDLNESALERYASSQGDVGTGHREPFVLIIDEINRANISKVFGELITLLEPDKRLCEVNELRVRLPYSGDLFGVPANLHIIGTMNTADRSIALIDKALRRRFTFREMMPDPDLPALKTVGEAAGVDLSRVLRVLNERIEYLLDREHQIGHAWFLGCDGRAALDTAMRERVIPLIAEYFFEDWGKTADVLGGRKDNPFLASVRLDPPPGMPDEQPRWRWSVRAAFSEDAYTRAFGEG